MRIDDHSFSEQLRLHASSLDLETICSVGDWVYGQSIRRAKGPAYFYDLSQKNFYPLGLNHPLMIRSLANDSAPQVFSSSLSDVLSGLKTFSWVVLSLQDYAQFKSQRSIKEYDSFVLTSIWGLDFLEKLEGDTYSVRISDGSYWVCSSLPLPPSSGLNHVSWLNLFFSTDVLGPNGRLAFVQKTLMKFFNSPEINGLSLKVKSEINSLAKKGVLADKYSETECLLHFPVSVLATDIERVAQIIASKDISC